MRKAAKMNKVKAPLVVFGNYKVEDQNISKNKHTVLDLFKTRNIRTATIILCFLWITAAGGYYTVSLNTSKLTSDPYLGCFISAVVELPANICIFLSLKYLPRRVCTVSVMIVAGVFLLLLPTIPPTLRWLSITMEMIGKFSFYTLSTILWTYTTEIFPTVLRNTATGMCSSASRMGSCLSPFIIQLSLFFTFLPPVLLGTLSIGSAFGGLFLPETFKKPLPEIIPDMQKCTRMHFPFTARQKTSRENAVEESKF